MRSQVRIRDSSPKKINRWQPELGRAVAVALPRTAPLTSVVTTTSRQGNPRYQGMEYEAMHTVSGDIRLREGDRMDSPCGALLTHACGPCDGLLQSAVHTVSGERLRQGDRIEVALLDPKECMKALPLGALLTHACGPCDGPVRSRFTPGIPFLSSTVEEGARCETRNRLRV